MGTTIGDGGPPLSDGASACAMDIDATSCISCCQGLYPTGTTQFITDVETCVCKPGVCETQCKSTYCAGMNPTTACGTCISNALATSGACYTPVDTKCSAQPQCVDYLNCAGACP
jgi:hypothetical protein